MDAFITLERKAILYGIPNAVMVAILLYEDFSTGARSRAISARAVILILTVVAPLPFLITGPRNSPQKCRPVGAACQALLLFVAVGFGWTQVTDISHWASALSLGALPYPGRMKLLSSVSMPHWVLSDREEDPRIQFELGI